MSNLTPGTPFPERRVRPATPRALRALLALDGAVFLYSALLNLGVRIPLGVTTLGFPAPVWQAAIGEIVIGAGLVAASWTGRVAHAWIAACAAAIGLAFGLLSAAVVGPARDIHLLLVPLTGLAFIGLVAVQATGNRSRGLDGNPAPAQTPVEPGGAVAILMAVGAASYAAASVVHFGLVVPLGPIALRDPFPGAAVPEALIAFILSFGAVAVARRIDGGWLGAVLASAFSALLTVFGLSIALRASRPGDVVYHVAVLALVLVILALLILPRFVGRGERRTA